MIKRQCLGFDKFHGCLSAIFPSNHDAVANSDNNCESNHGRGDVGGKQSKGKTCGDQHSDPDRASGSKRMDRRRVRIPVKFTKSAVDLLRETLNAFLRELGRDLSEEFDDDDTNTISPRTIHPEDVARILLAFDDDDDDEAISTTPEEEGPNGERTAMDNSNSVNRLEMKEIVSQARHLLVEQNRRECDFDWELENKNKQKITERNNDGPDMVGSGSGSACGINDKNSSQDEGTSCATAKGTVTLPPQQQQPKKRKRKRKKIKITADMEAEQERMLNASKIAFESSQQQQQPGGGTNAVTFRVDMA